MVAVSSGELDENRLWGECSLVSSVKTNIRFSKSVLRKSKRWSLVALTEQESLPCVLRQTEIRAMRASEEKAVGMSLVAKREQVARFAVFM